MRGIRHMHAVYSCTGKSDTVRCTYVTICRVHRDSFLFTDQRPQPGPSVVAPYGAPHTRASPQSPWSTAARSSDYAAIYHALPPNSIVLTEGVRKDAVDRQLLTTRCMVASIRITNQPLKSAKQGPSVCHKITGYCTWLNIDVTI